LDIVDKCQYYLLNTGPLLGVFALSQKHLLASSCQSRDIKSPLHCSFGKTVF